MKWLWYILISYPLINYGFIYHIQVLQKEKRLIIALSDWHDRQNDANKKQRDEILALLCRIPTHICKVVIEDLSSINNNGCYTCKQWSLQSSHGTLAHFSADCRERHIDVDNVEYRYCRVIGLGPLLRRNDQGHIAHCLTVQDIVAEVQNALQQVAAYADHPLLQIFYQQVVTSITRCMKTLVSDAYKKYSLSGYIACKRTEPQQTLLVKQLLTFDSSLLDCKLLHAIYNSKKPYTIMLAGGTHVARVCNMLQQIGYQSIFRMPATLPLFKGQSSMVPIYPAAVDVGVLNRFVH